MKIEYALLIFKENYPPLNDQIRGKLSKKEKEKKRRIFWSTHLIWRVIEYWYKSRIYPSVFN